MWAAALWCLVVGHDREEKMDATICGRCRRILVKKARIALPLLKLPRSKR